MFRLIYTLPITLILHACGGGSIDDMTQEELSQYPPIISTTETSTGTSDKSTIPVNCAENPKQCI